MSRMRICGMLSAPLALLVALMLTPVMEADETEDPRRPHIILIIADDLGWNDVGIHGSQLAPTPHLDALAAAGRLLQRHYALPTCTPSRSALLTGRHAAGSGMQGFPLRAGEPRGLPLNETTLAEELSERGYAARLVGKWHVGSHRSAYLPTRRGFLSHFGYRNGYVGYFDHSIAQKWEGKQLSGLDLWRDDAPQATERGQYLTHAFTREATRIIGEHAATQPERPLFLQLAHLAVHSGNDTTSFEVPDPAAAHRRFAYEPRADRRLYAEMVSQLDESVGTVLHALKHAAMLNDSIVVFISDNGGMTTGLHYNSASNWPMRGMKHTLFEGGVHTVGAVWSPRLRALRSPYPRLLHISDWAPTLLAAADQGFARASPRRDGTDDEDRDIFAGVSHWDSLSASEGEDVAAPRGSLLLNVDDVIGHSGVLDGHWKYVEGTHQDGSLDLHAGDPARGPGYPAYDAEAAARAARASGLDATLAGEDVLRTRAASALSCRGLQDTLGTPPCASGCLFNLLEDPCETRDASAHHPEQLAQLRAQLRRFRAQSAEQLNKPVDLASDPALHGGAWEPWLDEKPEARSRASAATVATIAATTAAAAATTARSVEL